MNLNFKKIILLVLTLSLFIATILWLLFRNKKTESSPADTEKNNGISQYSEFPTPQNNLPQKLSQEEIHSQIESFTKRNSDGVLSMNATDSQNNPVSLEEVLESSGGKIPPDISETLNKDDYLIFSCRSDQEKREFGIMISTNTLLESVEAREEEILRRLKNWENQMLKDLHPILFPLERFNPEFLEQNLFFKDGKFRYTEILLPDNASLSINYSVVNETIFITSSPKCLEEGAAALFEP